MARISLRARRVARSVMRWRQWLSYRADPPYRAVPLPRQNHRTLIFDTARLWRSPRGVRHKASQGLHVLRAELFGIGRHHPKPVAQHAQHAVGIGPEFVEHGSHMPFGASGLQGMAQGAGRLQRGE